MSHCMTCGRKLKDWRTCEKGDPAMDCGGDCWGCQQEYEREIESDFRQGDPIPAFDAGHMEGCRAQPIYKGDEQEPVLYISMCVEDCPRMAAAVARGKELAEEYGW